MTEDMYKSDGQAYQASKEVIVTADFGATVDYPLSKTKFPVYNSGIVGLDRYHRDIHLFEEVKPESLRIDMAWGAKWAEWEKDIVSGTHDNLRYDFSEVDELIRLLHTKNILCTGNLEWSSPNHCYYTKYWS